MKKKGKTYKFEDLVRVWKAAELNAKITGSEGWDIFLHPTDYSCRWQRSEGFITLKNFGRQRLLFKAMLPGLTDKNMKQILRDLRERSKEFLRRKKERYINEPDGVHPDRWKYGIEWVDGAQKHSLIRGRLYPLNPYDYRRIIRNYLERIKHDGTLARMIGKLQENVFKDLETHGCIKVTGQNRYISKNIISENDKKALVNKVVNTPWLAYHPSRIVSETELRSNNHIFNTTWVAPYKGKDGRAGFMLCIKLPQSSNDACWVDQVNDYIGPNQKRWIYDDTLILEKEHSVVVNHPETIEDWDYFVKCERGE